MSAAILRKVLRFTVHAYSTVFTEPCASTIKRSTFAPSAGGPGGLSCSGALHSIVAAMDDVRMGAQGWTCAKILRFRALPERACTGIAAPPAATPYKRKQKQGFLFAHGAHEKCEIYWFS